MAATAQTIIDRAMRLIGALESGESPTADETTDVLYALNAMLEAWRLEKLMVYAGVDVTHTLTPATGNYTIGTGATINTERPIRIDHAYMTESDTDVMIHIIGKEQWDGIADKTVTSNVPTHLYYEAAYPNGTIKLWPVPSAANVLTMSVWTVLGSLASAATSISLPPGYERALAYNLAVEIAPEFQQQVPEAVFSIAVDSKAAIKRVNVVPVVSQIEFANLGMSRNIYTDGL